MINYWFSDTEAMDKFAEDLFRAFTVVTVAFLTEEGAELSFGDDEIGFLEHRQHIRLSKVESDPQFLEDFIVGQILKRNRCLS